MSIVGMYITTFIVVVLFFMVFFKLIRIVPEQEAWVVEQFGKYKRTLGPGFHLVIPVVQIVAYKHILKEQVIDVAPQVCITQDNVQVTVDGILYLRVQDPERASYGIEDYRFATAQLAQTTMRSEIGKIGLDNTFSERDRINDAVVKAIDEASDPWGIKVTRYEIRDITPTETVLEAMEQQVRAERERRAEILTSEGEKEARINVSRGDRQQAINVSKGEKTKRINEADGKAEAITVVAQATADGVGDVAKAISRPHGQEAVTLQIAEQFVSRLGQIMDSTKTSVLPYDLAGLRSVVEAVRGQGLVPQSGSPSAGRSSGSQQGGSQSASAGEGAWQSASDARNARQGNKGGSA
ncbi:MAG: SPFH domain-containing protein [Spirochaetota bacterium]